MDGTDLMILQTGVCEKFKCSPRDIKEVYHLWTKAFTYEYKESINYDFLEMIGQMQVTLEELKELFVREAKITADFLIEMEVKKAIGTYDEYIAEGMKSKELLENFFSDYKKSRPANSNLASFN